jgi:hypothetical protein
MEEPWDSNIIEIERLLFKVLKRAPKISGPEKQKCVSHI